jgi:hypothetical protein
LIFQKILKDEWIKKLKIEVGEEEVHFDIKLRIKK